MNKFFYNVKFEFAITISTSPGMRTKLQIHIFGPFLFLQTKNVTKC